MFTASNDAAAPGGSGGNDDHAGNDGNDGENGDDPFGLYRWGDDWCDCIGCPSCSPQEVEYQGRPCANQCKKYGLENPFMIHIARGLPHVGKRPTCAACMKIGILARRKLVMGTMLTLHHLKWLGAHHQFPVAPNFPATPEQNKLLLNLLLGLHRL